MWSKVSSRSHPIRVRVLKQSLVVCSHLQHNIAPHTGACVETHIVIISVISYRSHPIRVRVLKQKHIISVDGFTISHPIRVRVLKHSPTKQEQLAGDIAPHTGACVETASKRQLPAVVRSHPIRVRVLKQMIRGSKARNYQIAPHTGACVQTRRPLRSDRHRMIAPHTGP